jgi:hypothetical protein
MIVKSTKSRAVFKVFGHVRRLKRAETQDSRMRIATRAAGLHICDREEISGISYIRLN